MLLTDGYPTILAVGNNQTVSGGGSFGAAVLAILNGLPNTPLPNTAFFYRCREVQPPDVDGGGPIEVSSMNNILVRTKVHKHLYSLGVITAHVEWDPADYPALMTPPKDLNVNLAMAIVFPDLSILTFWAWIDKFTPTSHKEGELPTAEMKIEISNLTSAGVESPGIFTAAVIGTTGVILP